MNRPDTEEGMRERICPHLRDECDEPSHCVGSYCAMFRSVRRLGIEICFCGLAGEPRF